MPHYEGELRAQPGLRYAIVASRWNPRIVDALVDGARRTLVANGIAAEAIDVFRVPGSWDLPLAADRLARASRHAGIVALGCVVRGDTRHYEHVADGCAEGLMRIALDHGIPVANGVLAVERLEDAQARADGSHGNKGDEAALAVIEMADLVHQLDDGAKPA
jgi:6,7-dimethyl-8-ribityllumazine synthase